MVSPFMQREARVSPAIPLQASARARTGPYNDQQDLKMEGKIGDGNLRVGKSFSSRSHQGHPAMNIGVFDWWREYFGRPEDQPLILALLLVLIAITLYVFL